MYELFTTVIYLFQKKHGTLYDSERDYHTGDLGNLPVREDDESWTVGYTIPAEIAGIFDESKYNVSNFSYIF